MVEPNYLTIKQLSAYSGFGIRTLRGLIRHPEHPLPHFRVGSKTIRISKTDFDNWINRYRIDYDDKLSEMVESIANDMVH